MSCSVLQIPHKGKVKALSASRLSVQIYKYTPIFRINMPICQLIWRRAIIANSGEVYVWGLFFTDGDRASDRLACQLCRSSVRDKPLRDVFLRIHQVAFCSLCRADSEQYFWAFKAECSALIHNPAMKAWWGKSAAGVRGVFMHFCYYD